MADAQVDWDQFYRDVGVTRKEGEGLTSRKVNTVAVDPFTGQPLRPPPNEVVVPGGQVTGTGFGSGYVAPPSHRLLPQPPGLPAVGAAEQLARGKETAAFTPRTPWPAMPQTGPFQGGYTAQPRVAGMRVPPQMDNGLFGVPMSKTMQAILANDPKYEAQRGAQGTPQIVQALIDRETQQLAGSIRGGADPGANAIVRTIKQSGDGAASRTELGAAIGDRNRKSASPTYNVSGSNNAFAPKSVQNSVRWQTGY